MDPEVITVFKDWGSSGLLLVGFFMLWQWVIKPEMKYHRDELVTARIDQQANETVVNTLHETAIILRECVRDLREVKDELVTLRKEART